MTSLNKKKIKIISISSSQAKACLFILFINILFLFYLLNVSWGLLREIDTRIARDWYPQYEKLMTQLREIDTQDWGRTPTPICCCFWFWQTTSPKRGKAQASIFYCEKLIPYCRLLRVVIDFFRERYIITMGDNKWKKWKRKMLLLSSITKIFW